MRNLLGRLLERPNEELGRIARFWDVDLHGRDRYADVAALYRTMTDLWAARDAWQQLEEVERTVIRMMETHNGAAVTADTVASETGLDIDESNRVLRKLYAFGIVSIEADNPEEHFEKRAPELFLPREIGMVLKRVDEEQTDQQFNEESLEALLATVPYPEVEEAATLWGARVTPGVHARAELVNIVRDNLERPERVSRYINNLSGAARELWARLKVAGGSLPVDVLFGDSRLKLAARRRVLRELGTPLLLWHGYVDTEHGPSRIVRIPQAILSPVKPEPPEIPDLQEIDDADVTEPRWVSPYSAVWDLLTILREVGYSGPRWRALVEGDRTLERRFQKRLWLTEPDTGNLPTGYVPFLAQIGASMGVLRDETGRATPGSAARGWRESAFSTAAQKMLHAWTTIESWPEGRERVDLSLWGASWPAFRTTLLNALGELEEGRWYDEQRFIQRLLQREPDLLRQAHVGAVGQSRLAISLDVPAEIDDRRARILTLIIGTTLETAGVWLGLIERSRHPATGTSALRLTSVGRWLTARDRSEPSLPSLGDAPLAVGANFQVLLYRPTPRRVWNLSSFAELQTLDRVSTYALTAEALIRSLASGIDLDQVVGYLEKQNGGPLPQNVSYTLAEWDRGYRRVWLRRAVLLLPEEGEDSERIAAALRDAGLDPEILADGKLSLSYDAPDAGERLYAAATRALRERGFAPLTQLTASDGRPKRS